MRRRRPRPHADARQDGAGVPAEGGPAALSRGDPAGLQPQRPARQQVQGAAQDPGARDRHRGDARAQSRRRSRRTGRACGRSNPELVAAIEAAFAPPAFEAADRRRRRWSSAGLRAWVDTNVAAHKLPHYAIVTVSLKPIGGTPGDATAEQMRVLADLAEEFGHDELRVSHEQNIILPHVPRRHLPAVYARLKAAGLATANVGLISDIIACPGMDYCALATARSIPVAQEIAEAFADLDRQRDIGPLKIKISGCINACGHHHVGPYRHPRARPGGGGELPDHPRRRRHRDRGDRREGRATASPTTRSCRRSSG